jgi:general secretion pathway protein K
VEIVPEAAKLDVNFAPPEQLYRLLVALGQNPSQAGAVAGAIVARRSPPGSGSPGNAGPSFPGGPASFQEIEDLLLVPGVTPEIFYGTYVSADAEGEVPLTTFAPGLRLIPRPGLEDCLSVFGSRGAVDINTAQPAVLAAVGVPAGAIQAIVARRRVSAITASQLPLFLESIGIATAPLRIGGNSIYTIRATARLRLPNGQVSDLRRTVAAQVKYMPPGYDAPIHVLRWYDTAWSN